MEGDLHRKPNPGVDQLPIRGCEHLEDECIVLQVVTKGKVPMPPMESIYAHIRESLLQQKKQLAVKTWMESVKKSAKITIHEKILQGIAHE